MSQEPRGHNPVPQRRTGRRRAALLGLAGLAWAATMGAVLRSEVLTRRESADVRELVESARLTRQHASARYLIRAGDTAIGTLSSIVSGSREEEQLAYVIEGELHSPLAARLRGVVVASWERKPERLVLDLDLSGVRHRVDGVRSPDGLFRVRYVPPGASASEALTWELDDPPPLAPGPLPIPALAADALSRPASGEAQEPVTGRALPWRLEASVLETLTLGGRVRAAVRHELAAGGFTIVAWTDAHGFPLRLDLPGGVTAELVEEGR